MGVFAKKFKAEIGALLSFLISLLFVSASKESWSPTAPILGFLLSLLICKFLIKLSIRVEKGKINSQSESAKQNMLDALKIISETKGKTGDNNSFSKLSSKIEENLISLFDNEMKTINDGLDKVKKLESESEDLDKDIEESVRSLIKSKGA